MIYFTGSLPYYVIFVSICRNIFENNAIINDVVETHKQMSCQTSRAYYFKYIYFDYCLIIQKIDF